MMTEERHRTSPSKLTPDESQPARPLAVCALRWDQLEFGRGELHVTRRKAGKPGVHSLRGSELRALRRLQREQTPRSPFVFTTERLAPMSPDGFRKLLTQTTALDDHTVMEVERVEWHYGSYCV